MFRSDGGSGQPHLYTPLNPDASVADNHHGLLPSRRGGDGGDGGGRGAGAGRGRRQADGRHNSLYPPSSSTTTTEPHARPRSPRGPITHASFAAPPPPIHPSTARPTFSRRSSMRSRSPTSYAHAVARKKYTYAAFFLVLSLISFTIQTELAAYIQHDMGWNKAYCMLYLTHGSWTFLWPVVLIILRLQDRDVSWETFWRRHVWELWRTAIMVEYQKLDVDSGSSSGGHAPRVEIGAMVSRSAGHSPLRYMARTTATVTTALTIAGASWYIAVNKTTPSDLTAIYNCSAFFAYAFSVPLLREKLRLDKSIAVGIAIIGVLVVAYGDTRRGGAEQKMTSKRAPQELDPSTRFFGNLIIGVGSVLYGLYEVLYKRYACPPDGASPHRVMVFSQLFGTLIGAFTLLVLWVPLPVLHIIGWETFELPTGYTLWLLFLSIVMNATFAGSFLVLISLTSPVLSSVAALLTIFIVAVVDWLKTGEPLSAGAVVGGSLIIGAFAMLSWSTWREMQEDERKGDVGFAVEDEETSSDEGEV